MLYDFRYLGHFKKNWLASYHLFIRYHHLNHTKPVHQCRQNGGNQTRNTVHNKFILVIILHDIFNDGPEYRLRAASRRRIRHR
ncbi:hypothetical protein TcasGA2_TC014206 [Tribolium castaneum]|uniref:Uncharacterized protein n=1 Tax=Tribolium castaneum TaxID=7070 RepID=D6W714_TRICA|nr:hypothetical protein TcasGA2_TC014206 [Tribolium castaneum]